MSNLSFTRVSNQLKELGIKNHDFFIRTYDKDLKKIDPYSNTLPMYMRIRVHAECIRNPWYYLREIARIPCQDGYSKAFELNLGNLAAIWCCLNNINFYITTPRETYRTSSILSIMNWIFLFGVINTEFLLFERTPEDVDMNLDKMLLQQKFLPDYLTHDIFKCQEYILNFHNNNKIYTKNSPNSQSKADNLGRMLTMPIQFFDNMEFIPHLETIIGTSSPVFHTSHNKTLDIGGKSCRMFSSVVNNTETSNGFINKKIVTNSIEWNEVMCDLGGRHIKDFVRENSINDMVYINYPYHMLGKDEHWFKTQNTMLLNDQDTIDSELLLIRK